MPQIAEESMNLLNIWQKTSWGGAPTIDVVPPLFSGLRNET